MVIENCPAKEDLYEWGGDFDINELPVMILNEPNYCVKYKRLCNNVENCVIKQILTEFPETDKILRG